MTRPATEMELRCTQAAVKAAWDADDRTPGLVVMVREVNIAAVVRATIRAMREPSNEMIAAVSNGDAVYTDEQACPTCGQAGTKTYRAYIDAASPPEQP